QPQPVSGSDSVDLYIVTRDVFGLGGSFSPRSFDTYRFGIYDVNIDGRGQRVQLNGIYSASKIYGLAGLRVGYLIGQPDTLQKIASKQMWGNYNQAGLAAAAASLEDKDFVAMT